MTVGNSVLSSFTQGDTKVFNLSFKDSDGQPIDITGHEIWLTMKRQITDADTAAPLQKRVICPADSESENGQYALTLTSNDTRLLDPGSYFFDFQKVIPENPPVVATLMSGRVTVLHGVTQSDGTS